MKRWLVKRRHYGGDTSVIDSCNLKPLAVSIARRHNAEYHSDNYYVEENHDYKEEA